ncbi:MAG: hypothetical protein GY804_07975 [Alphaproteobacteria bacterium]|nr:hypothetical protein [Alphaproteobacteria bacterium]
MSQKIQFKFIGSKSSLQGVDRKTQTEKDYISNFDDRDASLSLDDIAKKIQNDDNQQDVKLKKEFFKNVKRTVRCWLILIVIIVVLSGLNLLNLSDKVIIVLLTTTTLNVLTLYYYIGRYLFSAKSGNGKT